MVTKVDDVKEEVQQKETVEKETPQEDLTSTAESNTETLSNLSPDEYKEWRTSGKLPEKPAAKEDKTSKEAKPADSKKSVKKEEESEPSDDAEEDEGETPKPSKKVSRSEARRAELNEEIRTLATKRQQEQQALDDILEKKKKASEPEKKDETPKTISLKDLVAKIKARADKGEFGTYEEVIAATAETLVDERGLVSESKLQKMLSEAMDKFKTEWVKEQETEKNKSTVEAQRKAQEDEWVKKVNKAEGKHPDFKTVCFAKTSPAARIVAGSPLDKAIMKNPNGALLLYHICSVDGEVDRLNALDSDLDQPAEIKAIIAKLSEPEKSDEEKSDTPPPPTTRARRPPSEASGRLSAVVDESEAALKNKDVGAYIRAENAKEQKRRQALLGAKS